MARKITNLASFADVADEADGVNKMVACRFRNCNTVLRIDDEVSFPKKTDLYTYAGRNKSSPVSVILR